MDPLKEHGLKLQELAEFCFKEADLAYGEEGWSKLFHELRYDPDGGGTYLQKTVCLTKAGRQRLKVSTNCIHIERRLLELREVMPEAPWFGLRLFVTSEGDCNTEYIYDPDFIDQTVSDEKSQIPF